MTNLLAHIDILVETIPESSSSAVKDIRAMMPFKMRHLDDQTAGKALLLIRIESETRP